MARRLPPLNSLRVFEAAARYLSFTRAAEELFVTQAAVSHQVKALEEFLGIKLFRRRNRSLLLTEEGQSYFLDIKDIFTSISDATDKVLERSEKGALTISLTPSFAIQWLVPRLADFNAQEPDIDVRIKAVDMDEGLLSDDVDVAIYYGRGNWPGVRADKLYLECLIPVCSPQLLLGSKPLNCLADIKNHTLLHDSSRKYWKQFTKEHDIEGVNVNHGPIFSHSTMVIQAAMHGQGIALVNNVLAQPDLDSGRLVQPFDEVLISKNAFYVVCDAKQADIGRVATFRDWMLSKAASEQDQLLDEIGEEIGSVSDTEGESMSLESQQHKIMIDGDDKAAVTVLLAHGAGAGMDHEFMADIAEKLADHGVRVVRFNFPYMVTRAQDGKKRPPDRAPKLLADFEEKINVFHREGQPLFLAGKSMGGRMASHLSEHPFVTGVMCLGFPFHPPGKPENYKGDHLVNITKATLILQGERDTFGTQEECQSFAFSDAIHVDFIPDGDHSLKPRVKSGFTEQGNRALAVSKMMTFIEQHAQN